MSRPTVQVSNPEQPLPRTRLHVVTGKGGTGKTTVAAALALSLARGGRRVLLAEVEDRQGLARLFDVAPLGYDERSLTVAEDDGEVFGLAVEPKAALIEYLDRFYKAGPVASVLRKTGAVDFVTTIAPGLRDVLLTGKVYEAGRRQEPRSQRFSYDAVVLDAPPTGRVGNFLNVNEEVSGLARMGPIHQQASSIMTWLRSSAVVHLVTLLEEMPVQETTEAATELRRIGLPLGCVVVNQVVAESRAAAAPARDLVMAGLVETGVVRSGNEHTARSQGIVDSLLDQAAQHRHRALLQQAEREHLSGLDLPVVDLPQLPGGVDAGGLFTLADALADQGLRP